MIFLNFHLVVKQQKNIKIYRNITSVFNGFDNILNVIDEADIEKNDKNVLAKEEVKVSSFPPGSNVVGTFNTHDVIYVEPEQIESLVSMHSNAHCIGETFHDNSWRHRSCKYTRMCFDLEEKEFVLFQSRAEQNIEKSIREHSNPHFLTFSSALNTSLSLGSLNVQWTENDYGVPSLEWTPKILMGDAELRKYGFYQLAPGKFFLPFHSMAAINPGHLLWDDFLPIYLLLTAFQTDNKQDMVLVRYVLKNRERALWATCDLRDATLEVCKRYFKKFLPLMGIPHQSMRSTEDSLLTLSDEQSAKSKYVCADNGFAGMGMFSDHGQKTHGWSKKDYETAHNIGRAETFYNFRNFMLKNIQIDPEINIQTSSTFYITFATPNSKDRTRRPSIVKHINLVKDTFKKNDDINVREVNFSSLKLEEQLKVVTETSILISVCGGGAVTSMFLSKGASLIMLYPDEPEKQGRKNYPARLDWDFFSNQGYFRVHWVPISSMHQKKDLDLFLEVLKYDLENIRK